MEEQYGTFQIVMWDGRNEQDFSGNPMGNGDFVAGGLNWFAERVSEQGLRWVNGNDKLVKLNGGSAYISRALLGGLVGNNAQYYEFTERVGRVTWFDLGGYGDERLMQGIDDSIKFPRYNIIQRRTQQRNAEVINWIEGHWGRVVYTREEMAKWQQQNQPA